MDREHALNQDTGNDTRPVTVIVSRRVKPGRESDFEAWVAGVSHVARQFAGHQGIEVVKPAAGEREYTLIFRFSNRANLKKWEDSPERAAWLAHVVDMTEGEPVVQRVSGLEHWFPLPPNPHATPPPRYKMAIVTILALYPLINVVVPLLQWLLQGAHLLISSLLSVTIMVVLMTYVVMPIMVRLFSKWLYGTSFARKKTRQS